MINPDDYDIALSLCFKKMAEADECIFREQYKEAIAPAAFVARQNLEEELTQRAQLRLLTCYTNTSQLDRADSILNILQPHLSDVETAQKRAAILTLRGETEKALALYAATIASLPDTVSAQTRNNLIISYEEIAIPYIKSMTDAGLYKRAYGEVGNFLHVAPTNYLALLYAANLSSLLGDDESFALYTKRGRELYPDDLAFMIKESVLMDKEGRHMEATRMLYSKLEEYPGDSDLVNAFSGSSILLALNLSKEKMHDEAIAVLDTAIVYNKASKELLYTKGLIYERNNQYDSAYHYQRHYEPGTLESAEFVSHMKGLRHKSFKNTLDY